MAKSRKPYGWTPYADHWVMQINKPGIRNFIRFLETDDYTTVKDIKMAHVVRGSPEFVRGFCLAVYLCYGVDLIPIMRPPLVRYKKHKPSKTL